MNMEIQCKKCGTVIGDNGYGYCEPCYFELTQHIFSLPIIQVEPKMVEEDVTLSWHEPMTSKQAAKYHLTAGFVAVELYRKSFAAGRASAVRECVEAVELVIIETDLADHFEVSRIDQGKKFPLILRDAALAAIREVGEK